MNRNLILMALPQESQGQFEAHGIPVVYTGMGPRKVQRCLSQLDGKDYGAILNLGTCGSLSIQTGQLVQCTRFVDRDSSSPNELSLNLSLQLPYKEVICATGAKVQSQSPWPADVMDMEAYWIAKWALEQRLPLTCIKYVTDTSQGDVLSAWKQQLDLAAKALLRVYQSLEKSPNP